ncbi:hypothetical protein KC887_02925 [Candidatus Kaiserbacteria bacterium]|nr:hypothetical protein [Candidatus Kaiserbacteria bacterium]
MSKYTYIPKVEDVPEVKFETIFRATELLDAGMDPDVELLTLKRARRHARNYARRKNTLFWVSGFVCNENNEVVSILLKGMIRGNYSVIPAASLKLRRR